MSNLLHAHIFRIFIFSWRIKPFSMQYQFLSLVIFLVLKTTLTSTLSFSQWSTFLGVPGLTSGKQSAYQCRRPGFDPWVGKIPWRRKWQPIPVCLPGEPHGQRSLVGQSPWGCREWDTTEATQHTTPLLLSYQLLYFK